MGFGLEGEVGESVSVRLGGNAVPAKKSSNLFMVLTFSWKVDKEGRIECIFVQ